MAAAGRGFSDPPAGTKLAWVPMVEDVFNKLVARFDTESCGGGLRWQVPFANRGYEHKDALPDGLFFSLGARLARYTGNKTYAEWADRAWDWVEGIGFVDNQTHAVHHGAKTDSNCKRTSKAEITANNAIFVLGASCMYNQRGLHNFFPYNVAYEAACGKEKECLAEITFFKGLMHQGWTASTQVAPFISETVLPVLRSSAAAAVKQCTGEGEGEADGRLCRSFWAREGSDGRTGVGEQMSALAAVTGLLVSKKAGPHTAKSGKGSGGSDNGGNGGAGGDGKADNGTSSGGKNGKDSAAGKIDRGVLGITVIATGRYVLIAWYEVLSYRSVSSVVSNPVCGNRPCQALKQQSDSSKKPYKLPYEFASPNATKQILLRT
ncbi:glycosyl hydrolase, putative [Metarhizium acridum CQMa 102]|uniref:mannan endo-1,6-alpha-mannosidase n=2 Tax=Metarhizium acridum TaxID=92637 RepID=E9DRU0_METAQ|nr:glycosyl hydrolase, putative [Metarhizium acridum CQMa 102]EFY93522.1 glycosyl hydrolase, putative [Metarhizium acridum CQMa 102]